MAFIRSESEWLANKVIQGLVASPIEMLIEASIADVVSESSELLQRVVLRPRTGLVHRFIRLYPLW